MTGSNKQDIYTRITDQIVSALEQGVKPWTKPWSASHAAGHVSRPLRHNGQAYAGINVLTLWCSAMERSYCAPIWMTFKQAIELGGCVRKGEKGFWTRIGAAWDHKNGEGYTLALDLVPVDGGRIVLRPPRDENGEADREDAGDDDAEESDEE